uniref:NlpC/P60 family protein n=1 Tax=Desulfobacca acetoxidans TaxID=60893 RepID=A0A7C3Z352_9BACT
MAKKIILCLGLTLAILLAPQITQAVPTKGVNKKTSLTRKSSKSSSKSYQSSKSSRRSAYSAKRSYSSRKSRSYSEDEGDDNEDFVPTYYKPYKSARTYDSSPSYSSTPYSAGILDSRPLMKVTPQRDGRFLLEPLAPKPKTGPTSKLDDNKNLASGGRGYNLYEPWNFRDLVLAMAKGYYGTPYRYGASLEYGNATDCSGFVQYIYKGFKIDLPRSSSEQAQVGKSVTQTLDFSKLVPGDILFFSRGGRHVGHAGIYLGEGKMIHASTYRTGVIITDLRDGHYQDRFVVAKRVFEVSYLK